MFDFIIMATRDKFHLQKNMFTLARLRHTRSMHDISVQNIENDRKKTAAMLDKLRETMEQRHLGYQLRKTVVQANSTAVIPSGRNKVAHKLRENAKIRRRRMQEQSSQFSSDTESLSLLSKDEAKNGIVCDRTPTQVTCASDTLAKSDMDTWIQRINDVTIEDSESEPHIPSPGKVQCLDNIKVTRSDKVKKHHTDINRQNTCALRRSKSCMTLNEHFEVAKSTAPKASTLKVTSVKPEGNNSGISEKSRTNEEDDVIKLSRFVQIRKCWQGEPDAISSIRRRPLSRDQRKIHQLIHKCVTETQSSDVIGHAGDPKFIPPYPVHFKSSKTNETCAANATKQKTLDGVAASSPAAAATTKKRHQRRPFSAPVRCRIASVSKQLHLEDVSRMNDWTQLLKVEVKRDTEPAVEVTWKPPIKRTVNSRSKSAALPRKNNVQLTCVPTEQKTCGTTEPNNRNGGGMNSNNILDRSVTIPT